MFSRLCFCIKYQYRNSHDKSKTDASYAGDRISIGIPIIKIRLSDACVVFFMGLTIPGKMVFILKCGPILYSLELHQCLLLMVSIDNLSLTAQDWIMRFLHQVEKVSGMTAHFPGHLEAQVVLLVWLKTAFS